ncbi:alpha/beta hydrolase [Roseibium denhamense]|uniref:Serine aminopeptidase S33 domain-containing protein n=1 Tax=Roseibium denhamense TaxID=76305 RepID=A0ABY1P2C8_9HYPH|nr:alpha/beta hydrolase [Roseibium denhamense]MTI07692.1 alpha/beta hydrolase [Roseibium denhamense]SMP24707.1 hypothetical protein SAMN06265374_2460 [Roseibium denhamense]
MTKHETGQARGSSLEDTAPKASLGARSLRVLRKILFAGLIAYAIVAGYMYVAQRSMVFPGSGVLETPEAKGLSGVAVDRIAMADGTNVTVWSAPPASPGLPTLLYFQGNAQPVSTRWKRFKMILDSGYGLYVPTYRGYPGSEGSPSEEALIADALAHYDRLKDLQDGPVILHGESLGTGLATAVAAVRPDVDLLVLEAPYTALVDIATEQYPWLPVRLLMKDPMPTRDRIKDVTAPVLIFHGTEDRIIPVAHGQRLFDAAPDPKEIVIFDGGQHGDLWTLGLWEKVSETYAGLETAR